MENQLVKANGAALPSMATSSFLDVDSRDLVLPKLLLMQGLSELVAEEKAKMGDIINSLTDEVVGGKDKPVEVIPFFMKRTYIVEEKLENGFAYKETVPVTSQNAHWRDKAHREEMVNGVLTRRTYSMDFFMLLASEAGQEDALPIQVSFRRTSEPAGRQLYTRFLLTKGQPTHTWLLSSKKKENDKGTFYVFEVTKGKALTDKQKAACTAATGLVNSGNYQVDEEKEHKAAPQGKEEF